MSPSARNARLLTALANATVLGGICAALLWRAIYQSYMVGFDSMLYGRGIWGVGHGDFWNPVLEKNQFGVHAHFWLLALSPLVHVLRAGEVLILGQACSLAAVVGMVAWEFSGIEESALLREKREVTSAALIKAGLYGVLVAVLGTAVVSNPFIFDARTDVIGAAFTTAALLRAWRVGAFDWRAVVYFSLGVLAREEFGLVMATALLACPNDEARPGALSRKTRHVVAAAAALWFPAYYFGWSHWIGRGDDVSALLHLTGRAPEKADVTPGLAELLRYKSELLAAAVCSGGGFWWAGRRWLWAALPGGLFLIGSRYGIDAQLTMHYPMFVVPGFVTATVAGFSAWRTEQTKGAAKGKRSDASSINRRHRLAAGAALAVFSYFAFGSWPFGHRFLAQRFDLATESGTTRLDWWNHTPKILNIHKQLEAIPRDAGLAVEQLVGAPMADRKTIWHLYAFTKYLRIHKDAPPSITWAAFTVRGDPKLGPYLARIGFHLVWADNPEFLVFTRDKSRARIPWNQLVQRDAPAECANVRVRWPDSGFALCELVRKPGALPYAWLYREGEARTEGARRSLVFDLAKNGERHRLRLFNGLVDLADVPVGSYLRVEGYEQVPGDRWSYGLFDANDKSIHGERVQ